MSSLQQYWILSSTAKNLQGFRNTCATVLVYSLEHQLVTAFALIILHT
jgi:hypothetical protein